MEYIQEITLDLNTHSAPLIINAKQNDTDSRILLVHFTKNGEEYRININNSVAFRVRKPDMHLILDDGIVNNDGTVKVILTQQCLAMAGRAYADLVEFNSSGQMLSTVSFIIDIQAMPDVMGNEAISSDEFLYLKSFIDRGNQIAGMAQVWANGYNGDVPVTSDDPAYNNHAKYWAQQAEAIGTEKVNDAEAWARGTKNGSSVSSSDQTYHNNAKYYSEQSQNYSQEAKGYSDQAKERIENTIENITFSINSNGILSVTFNS